MYNYSTRWVKLLNLHWVVYLAIAVVMAAAGVYSMRQNNLRMGELKAEVITADEAGEDTQPALQNLGGYVFKHMNTSTEVTLATQYSRDAQAAIAANRPDDGDDQVYEDARRECENPNIPLTARANCVAEYVSANSPEVEQDEIKLPPEQQYVYSFASPLWSADLAGFSLLGAACFAGLGLRSWLRVASN